MRDRLRKIILDSEILCHTCGESTDSYCAEAIADYLLANGVIVAPCKVRDTLYVNYKGKIYPVTVNAIRIDTKKNIRRICVWGTFHIYGDYAHEYKATFSFDSIGKTVFLTQEEAEQALKGGGKK